MAERINAALWQCSKQAACFQILSFFERIPDSEVVILESDVTLEWVIMKNPNLVAKVSLTVLTLVIVLMIVAAVIIPNMVEDGSESQASTSFLMLDEYS